MAYPYPDDTLNPVGNVDGAPLCLNVLGWNRMLFPFQAVPGNPIKPGFSFQGDERTGFYSDSQGSVTLSLTAFPRFRWSSSGFSLISLSGISGTLTQSNTADRTYTLPDFSDYLAVRMDIPQMVNEQPSGTVDGMNVTFTLSQFPDGLSTDPTRVLVFADGDFIIPISGFARSSRTLTLAVAPATSIRAVYWALPFLRGTGWVNSNSFGAGSLGMGITGTGFANSPGYGSGIVGLGITGSGFANTSSYGSGVIGLGILGSGFSDGDDFGAGDVA